MVAKRELVRCACGVTRGASDDAQLQIPSRAVEVIHWYLVELLGGEPRTMPFFEEYEPPRICRACGAIYMMPRQVEPSSTSAPH